MKKLILTMCLLVLLSSCKILRNDFPALEPVCRHKALVCAIVAAERFPVRLVVGFLNGIPHVQTQAYWDKEWIYIRLYYKQVVRFKTFEMDALWYPTIDEYIIALKKGWKDS